MTRLILASSSPRRLNLLEQIGVSVDEIIAPEIDEAPRPKEKPRALAMRLAESKALCVQDQLGNLNETDNYILAADTVVSCGRRVLGHPLDEVQARCFLKLLSGRRHHVCTAVTILAPKGLAPKGLAPKRRTAHMMSDTVVGFARLSEQDIETFISTDEWKGCAGGYAIQGHAARFVSFLRGSFSGVVGLPLHETYRGLLGLGFVAPSIKL